MRSEVHIRTLLFRLVDPNLLRRVDVRQGHGHGVRRELTIFDVKVWKGFQSADVEPLVMGRCRIVGARTDSSSKVVNFLDRVGRQEGLSELREVKPLVWRPLQRTIIEVEAIDVEVDDCHSEPQNSTLHTGTRPCRIVKETPPAPWRAGSEAGPRGPASVFSKQIVVPGREYVLESSRLRHR